MKKIEKQEILQYLKNCIVDDSKEELSILKWHNFFQKYKLILAYISEKSYAILVVQSQFFCSKILFISPGLKLNIFYYKKAKRKKEKRGSF